ncbi:hypothetical protein NIES2101_41495, partial [Calothrix sp. HK-06]
MLLSRREVVVNVQKLDTLKQQIYNLSKDIDKLKHIQVATENDRYLTKTHLTPIINKLHQLQRQQKAIELGAIANLTQTVTSTTELSKLTSCSILNKLKETGLLYEKSTFY